MLTDEVRAGVRTGYVDLAQISFLRPIDGATTALQVHNVAAIAATFAAQGAHHLIVNGTVDADTARRLRELGDVRIVRLAAGQDDLRARIASRHCGDGDARLIGDDLNGADADRQSAVLAAAVGQGEEYDRTAFEDLLIDTHGQEPASLAAQISRQLRCRSTTPRLPSEP